MARLIPSHVDDHTPPGERDVFVLLASGPNEWVALHSLDLAPWNRSLRTEIDFLVIVPDTGLLCIEVKSHTFITFMDDRWWPNDIRRSPFKQAADARHTFYRRVRELIPQLKHVPIVHCCIFPNAAFDLGTNLSIDSAELIDGRTFRAFGNGAELCESLRARMRHLIGSDENLHSLPRPLSAVQIDTIIGICVPVQRRRPSARQEIERREAELEHILRSQQKPVLHLAMTNPRLVVTGAAGTGKTMIAMEVARRACERGRRVALICFNQLAGDWLAQNVGSDGTARPNLIVGRAMRVVAELVGLSLPKNPPPSFWDNELPSIILERLTQPDLEASATFDYIVVDEAQDLLARPRLWDCIMALLDGGVTNGSFCLLGDFENQVLSSRETMIRTLARIRAEANPTVYPLTENCRNYRIIGESALRLSGINIPVYEDYLRSGGSLQNYDISFYRSDAEQERQILCWLKEFAADGYSPAEITILSFRSPDQSVAASLVAKGIKLRPAWQASHKATTYTSVHAFKGMENKVIILTDVVLGSAGFHRDLFYTGMTRACESLRISCAAESRDTLAKWIIGELSL